MRAGIALGSNVGDRLRNLQCARDELRTLHRDSTPFVCSKIYETEPVGCAPGTQSFLNAVVEMDFGGDANALWKSLREIETKLGRANARERNAPRSIDLDIVFFGELKINEPLLTIPHPRAHERRFVLQPLCDIGPFLILPGQTETVARLLEKLPPLPAVEVLPDSW